MRPVHDSNGVYRYCIGVQFELTEHTDLKERLHKLDKLIQLLPSKLDVGEAPAVGDVHAKEDTEEGRTITADELYARLHQRPSPHLAC